VADNIDLAEILENSSKNNALTMIEWFEKSPTLSQALNLIIEIKIIEPQTSAHQSFSLWQDANIRQFTIKNCLGC
jgi:tRNA A37 threonylcarbamoyladenosine biosynthesis protein TsaE